MAVKTIDPQLKAYYEQLRHPLPEVLKDLNVRSIHDQANIRYNERLWQKIKQMNAENDVPGMSDFRRIAADVRKSVDIELYECDDPDRLALNEICTRVWDAQIGLSPMGGSENEDHEDGDYRLAATIAISVRGLSRKEVNWIRECFKDHRPDDSGGDHTIALISTIDVDSIEAVDRWLPKRIRAQIFDHIRSHAKSTGQTLALPLSLRWKLFIRQIF